MTRLEITDDELNQLINLIEKTIVFNEVIDEAGLLPHSFNQNTMEFLLIRLKSM